MSLSTTSYHPSTGRRGRIFFEPEELGSGRFTGWLEMEPPEETGGSVRFSIDEVQDMHVAPYEVSVSPEEDRHYVSLRITGSNPRVTFSPDQPDTDEQSLAYTFYFPDLPTVEFCVQFLEGGLTESLISGIQEKYDADRSRS